jgi:heptosyltransferase-2
MTETGNIPDFGEIISFPRINIPLSAWRDGLVVRTPNWLGDAVMAVPALVQLKKIVPSTCGMFVVVPPALKTLFESMEFIDKVVPLHKAHAAWTKQDVKNVFKLRAGIALLQNNSLRDTIYFRTARIPRLYGAAKRGRSILLTESFKFPKIRKGELNHLHHAGRYLAMAYALGAPEWKGELPEFRPAKEPELFPAEVAELLEKEKLLVIAPGAAYGEAKRWPADNFRAVCAEWLDNGGHAAVIGTAAEKTAADEVCNDLPENKIANLAGKTDLADIIEILKQAEVCVANDSGIMHLSAVLGGKGAAIFGSTDPSSTSPVSTKWKILFEQKECAPCFRRECPYGHYECLKAITPEMVSREIRSFHK